MNPRETTIVSLLLAFEFGTEILGIPGLSFIKIYFMASLVYILSDDVNKMLFFLIILESTTLIFYMIYNFPFYLSLIENMMKLYKIKGDPWTVLWILMCFTPYFQIILIKGAKYTIRRFKIRERVGGFSKP